MQNNIIRCLSCQKNVNPDCKLCIQFNANQLFNYPMQANKPRKVKQSQELFLRQFDESQTSHMATPTFMDDRSMFDLNTREDTTNVFRESAKNDILFSRTISALNENKLNNDKLDNSRKEVSNPRFDFGLYDEPYSNNVPTGSREMSHEPNKIFDSPMFDRVPSSRISEVTGQSRMQSSSAFFERDIKQNDLQMDNSRKLESRIFEQSQPRIEMKIPEQNIISPLINTFSTNIMDAYYKILNKKKFLFSPYLLFIALYALLRGSYGETEKEIENMLLFENINKNNIFNMLLNIQKLIQKESDITSSNILINNINIPIRSGYYKVVSNILNLVMVNTKKFQVEMNEVNTQFRSMMKNTIPDIITPVTFSKLDPGNFNMAIIQSMHYYSKWKISFNKGNTRKEFFVQKDLKQRLVEMMNMFNSEHWFIQNNNNQLIEIEYANSKFRFGCYLPENVHTESYIDPDELSLLTNNLQKVVIKTLKIPKFSQTSKFFVDELYKKILDSNTLFSNANIPYISPTKNLMINKIIQCTNLIIDEKGTMDNPKHNSNLNIVFSANRPFFYYIRHIPTNTLILMGSFE
jgi:hypothetical protein